MPSFCRRFWACCIGSDAVEDLPIISETTEMDERIVEDQNNVEGKLLDWSFNSRYLYKKLPIIYEVPEPDENSEKNDDEEYASEFGEDKAEDLTITLDDPKMDKVFKETLGNIIRKRYPCAYTCFYIPSDDLTPILEASEMDERMEEDQNNREWKLFDWPYNSLYNYEKLPIINELPEPADNEENALEIGKGGDEVYEVDSNDSDDLPITFEVKQREETFDDPEGDEIFKELIRNVKRKRFRCAISRPYFPSVNLHIILEIPEPDENSNDDEEYASVTGGGKDEVFEESSKNAEDRTITFEFPEHDETFKETLKNVKRKRFRCAITRPYFPSVNLHIILEIPENENSEENGDYVSDIGGGKIEVPEEDSDESEDSLITSDDPESDEIFRETMRNVERKRYPCAITWFYIPYEELPIIDEIPESDETSEGSDDEEHPSETGGGDEVFEDDSDDSDDLPITFTVPKRDETFDDPESDETFRETMRNVKRKRYPCAINWFYIPYEELPIIDEIPESDDTSEKNNEEEYASEIGGEEEDSDEETIDSEHQPNLSRVDGRRLLLSYSCLYDSSDDLPLIFKVSERNETPEEDEKNAAEISEEEDEVFEKDPTEQQKTDHE